MTVYKIAFMGLCLLIANTVAETKNNNPCEGGEGHGCEPTSGVSTLQVTVSKGTFRDLQDEPFEDDTRPTHSQLETPKFATGENIDAVEAVFPALSVDTASFLQSDTPLALLDTKPTHAFTVTLGGDHASEKKIDEGEYMLEGIAFQYAPNSKVQWQGQVFPIDLGGQWVCPSRTLVCSGKVPVDVIPETALIRTGCVCKKGALIEIETTRKVIKVALHENLNDEQVDAAVRQIAHLQKENNDLLILDTVQKQLGGQQRFIHFYFR